MKLGLKMYTFRLLGDGRGHSAGTLTVFRAERVEGQSLVESHIHE